MLDSHLTSHGFASERFPNKGGALRPERRAVRRVWLQTLLSLSARREQDAEQRGSAHS